MVDYLYIIACRKDYKTFSASCSLVLKNVRALSFAVVVPDEDYDLFKSSSNGFRVIKESFIMSGLSDKINIKNIQLRKWYFQQILKIELIARSPVGKIVLVWDGDTIPFKKISLYRKGLFHFYKSEEHHKLYFDTIFNLLGISKNVNFSFISQHIVCKADWAKLMINCIERNTNKHYINSIVKIANSTSKHAFSEYETLGAFVSKYFFYELKFLDSNKWFRFGNTVFHSPYSSACFSSGFDFISFESWEKNFSMLKRLIIKFIFFTTKFKRIFYL